MKKFEKDAKQLRAELKAAGVVVKGNPGLEKLQSIAADNGIELEEARNTRSIVPSAYKEAYAKNGGTCGDELAAAISELAIVDGKADAQRLSEIADQNGVDFSRWRHLNIGQQRMNLSNVLRGKLKKGENVKVGKHTFKAAA